MDNPLWVFVVSLSALLLADMTGAYFSEKRPQLSEGEKNVLGVILTGVLTLYAVIIGFSFSMATARYDQRKNYEEAEANAIGTEYLRLGLLAPADARRARSLLKSYLDNRILFYTTRDQRQLDHIDSATDAIAGRALVDRPEAQRGATHPSRSDDRHRYERRTQLAELHAGRVVESHPGRSLGPDRCHQSVLLRAVRLLRDTRKRQGVVRVAPDNSRDHVLSPCRPR